ncbi:hypothetical protein GWO43_09910 [candidate division KSB1 bacterium]|nr:hypothetical protein [candidate division KSB1 bacterium]NIR69513.1 hypothetical protein [candidate division KSB1 bacterium]NIS24281.1 hypothetical protein [candidate division KSB1 bacterium]NIT71196.1 hypothetical protein [candidate division KSB1 bacterium]NIU24900.1 hypothetical protein [candidate division KSB1 bacterium]
MGPNDAELVRVFTREVGGTIGDVTFPDNQDIEIVVEAEVGTALFNTGGAFNFTLCVRDLCTFDLVQARNGALADILEQPGTFGAAPWANLAQQFTFVIPASELANRAGHILEILVCLQVGIATVDASFARSPLFHITVP